MNVRSLILSHINNRTEEFRTNPKLDQLISRLKLMLEPIQINQNKKFVAPEYPVVLIIGCSRSGTTLLTQILAASKSFSFPTNFLSRFAYAPQLGAMIQNMLLNPEYDFRGELSDIQSNPDFSSNVGKTKGALGINEFFHFWRKFFPNHDPGHLTDEDLRKVDVVQMRKELASIESEFDQPFMSKGMMLQYNINHFAKHAPEIFFVYIKRNPRFVMQSLLLSRQKYYGSVKLWRGVKPKEYNWLATLDHYHQIAGQVLFTEKAINEQLSEIAEHRKLTCYYEDLCTNPNYVYNKLYNKFKKHGYSLNKCHFDKSFTCGNIEKIDKDEIYQLESAYNNLSFSHNL